MSLSLIIAVTFTIAIVLIVLSCTLYIYLRRRIYRRAFTKKENWRNQVLHFYDCERRVKDLIGFDQFKGDDMKGIDVPFFNLESILAATDNFSNANKLGEGGSGPVYKGTFPGGQEIAVKKQHIGSGQGLEEFMNEVVLIAKLQHRNIVRLLGYCVQGDEKILLYEYMLNKSGYMSPEYVMDGVFSDKSDVFTFGVTVLEIISGKRNLKFYSTEQANIIVYAWRLWNEDKALDLMDQTLRETCNINEFLKCVNVGLLCIQEDPIDRPTMSNVVFMLGNETATLPTPKEPAFIDQGGHSSTASSSSKPETHSINELTITVEEGSL